MKLPVRKIKSLWRSLVLVLLLGNSIFAFPIPSNAPKFKEPDHCLQCHGNQPPPKAPLGASEAPMLPEQFSMSWQMFEFKSETPPPFKDIPAPYATIPGDTYYDWTHQSMTEIYREKCIDIFPEGRDYPCQFTSLKDKTYFIKYAKGKPDEPVSCCRWRKSEFYAPRPDVLQNMSFDKQMSLSAGISKWWILNIPMPGPFGYGLFEGELRPAAFWFPVISGWVQQNFSNFINEKPDPKFFQLPSLCGSSAPICADPG